MVILRTGPPKWSTLWSQSDNYAAVRLDALIASMARLSK